MHFLSEHILSILTFTPLAAALVLMLVDQRREGLVKGIAAAAGVLCCAESLWIYCSFHPTLPGFQFVEQQTWIQRLGISYHLGLDGINAPMILLTGILTLAVILVSFNIKRRVRDYFVLTLIVLTGVFGLFASLDLFLFLLFYELASVPMYFLIGIWGSDKTGSDGRTVKKEYAATKLILYLQLGGGLILLGILGLYFAAAAQTGQYTFDWTVLAAVPFAKTAQQVLFPILFIAFAIEAGAWPLHTWLPDGHSAAPTALSMLLAGVLLKMGGYGIIRVAVSLFPDGAQQWMPLFMIGAVINILYGAACALKQTDLKYIIAYSSVSHMGIVILGIGAATVAGAGLAADKAMALSGAVFQMFSHGIITALLFAIAGYIYEKTHTRDITQHGGLAIRMPYLATLFVIGGLATLGLPGLSGFVAELMVFVGGYALVPVLILLAVVGLVMTATYILRAVQKVMYGPLNPAYEGIHDVTGVERVPLAILAVTSILFGCWPSLLITLTNPAIQALVDKLSRGGV